MNLLFKFFQYTKNELEKIERKKLIEKEDRRKAEQEKIREEQERIQQLEEENKRKDEQEKIRQEQERILQLEEENIRKVEQEKIRQEQEDERIRLQYQEMIEQITAIQQKVQKQPIQQQIVTLNQEIQKLDNNNELTNNQKQYYKNQYQQLLFTKLKDSGQAKSIPHVKQKIEESLLRDQNRELLATSQQFSFGFDSILGAYGSDQSCLKVRNTNLDYDSIVNDTQLLEQHLLEFKQKLSNSLNISIDQNLKFWEYQKEVLKLNFKLQEKISKRFKTRLKIILKHKNF
ncbi:unnamed protein product (macronuclear) [Paramecium tetraurelia]|uniref:Uncharacterized protein n=1 Tax=Paramecium tetraurelia TaxID=5888 RepID=A0DE01_PARTE|nr:uncharacterized protein GSPATT00016110001 [Paramecium tetraurelia]CAK81268.1 unnamed protein product [Paramecium tetraurelia]|eukprot:XP_001448665.1 hypothetical protein (macronuclear) [Paramecium tetraurelia strain d4-2]